MSEFYCNNILINVKIVPMNEEEKVYRQTCSRLIFPNFMFRTTTVLNFSLPFSSFPKCSQYFIGWNTVQVIWCKSSVYLYNIYRPEGLHYDETSLYLVDCFHKSFWSLTSCFPFCWTPTRRQNNLWQYISDSFEAAMTGFLLKHIIQNVCMKNNVCFKNINFHNLRNLIFYQSY